MPIEIEKSYAVTDEKAVRSALERHGKFEGVHLFRQANYDSWRSDVKTVRVRDEGRRIAFTVKRRTTAPYLEESEKQLVSFDDAQAVCDLLGLKRLYYLEKLREVHLVGHCTVTLDAYPGLPPARLEIEAPSEDEMTRVAKLLGIPEGTKESDAADLYLAAYGITRDRAYGDLTFTGAAEALGPLIRRNREGFDACLAGQRATVRELGASTPALSGGAQP